MYVYIYNYIYNFIWYDTIVVYFFDTYQAAARRVAVHGCNKEENKALGSDGVDFVDTALVLLELLA